MLYRFLIKIALHKVRRNWQKKQIAFVALKMTKFGADLNELKK